MRLALLIALAPTLVAIGSPAAAQGQGVCFFEHANFQGQRACFAVGQRIPLVQANDTYSSVQVPPGIRVTICEHQNFGGRCIPIDRTIGNFNEIGFNDRVSSVAVEAMHVDRGPGPGRPRDYEPPFPPRMGGGPPPRMYDDARAQMRELRMDCEDGDRRACIRFGIAIGRNWERRERWQQESPEFFSWDRDR